MGQIVFHLVDVFGHFPVKPHNKQSQRLDKPLAK